MKEECILTLHSYFQFFDFSKTLKDFSYRSLDQGFNSMSMGATDANYRPDNFFTLLSSWENIKTLPILYAEYNFLKKSLKY